LSPDDLDRLRRSDPSRRIPPRNRTKADILVYRFRGTWLALKDYSARPWPIRNTVGRFLVRRESAAYAAAGEIEGLPRFLGRVGPYALATAWIDAQPLAGCSRDEVPEDCFDRLAALVDRLHRRGVALGDLHQRDVLVGHSGALHVVDLATAWTLGTRGGWLRRSIFERLREQDHIAVARMRARFLQGNEEEAIDAVGLRAAARYRRARKLKAWFDRVRGRNA
jgi:hypothetical protein